MGVGAAIIGSAVIGGVASMAGASAESSAAKKGAAASQSQYAQTRADLAPWRNVGSAAVYELGALSGLPGDYPGGDTPAPEAGNGLYFDAPGQKLQQQNQPAPQNQPQQPNGLYGAPVDAEFTDVPPDMAQQGRRGDTEVAHVAEGEIVVPQEVAQQPGVRNALYNGFQRTGNDPGQFIVGGRNRVNPRTGRREFAPNDGGWDEGGGFGREDFDNGYGGRGGDNPRDTGQEGDRGGFWNPGQQQPQQAQQPGLPEGYYDQSEAIDRFYDSPEYTVPFDEGVKALDASAASQGGLFSGNQMSAITRYGQDLASNRYSDYWNHLYGLSSSGANAAAQTGQFGMQNAQNQGYYYGQQGQAQAGGYAGLNNAIIGGAGNYLYYQGVQ